MPRTSIKVSNVINASFKGISAKNTVSTTETGIEVTRWAIDSKILNRNNINNRLINVKNSVGQIEDDIAEICVAISNGALKYQSAENKVADLSKELGAVYTKTVTQNEIVSKGYSTYFHEASVEEKVTSESQLTESQKTALVDAVKNNDITAALKALGVNDVNEVSEEDFNLLKELWDNSVSAVGNTVNDAAGVTDGVDAISGIEWDLFTAALESSGSNITRLAGWINTVTAVARGPQTANSFVIVNPQVASKTATIAGAGNKLTTAMSSTAAKVGVPIVGGLIDFGIMVHDGEEVGDAAVKATAHVGIGLAANVAGTFIGGKAGMAVGAAVGSIIPGAGTAVGAVVGFVAGVAITAVGNAIFDTVYDNWDDITAWVDEKGQQIEDGLNAAKDWAVEKGQEFVAVADKAVDAAVDWAQEKGEQIAEGIDAAKDWAVEKGRQIAEVADDAMDAASYWVTEKSEQVLDFFEGIGNAVSGGWNLLGGIFG